MPTWRSPILAFSLLPELLHLGLVVYSDGMDSKRGGFMAMRHALNNVARRGHGRAAPYMRTLSRRPPRLLDHPAMAFFGWPPAAPSPLHLVSIHYLTSPDDVIYELSLTSTIILPFT